MMYFLRQPLEAVRRVLHERTGLVAGRTASAQTIDIRDDDDVIRWSAWGSYGEAIRMYVDSPHLVMQGALNFGDSSHPFLQALSKGKSTLGQYYESRAPSTLCELHSIKGATTEDERVAAWEVPWIQRVQRTPPPGECGLGPEHGVSFYGPVSPSKLALEYERLVVLRDRIERRGYHPELYGDIDGYFLRNEQGDFRFFVRGGKHRAAVLVHLGMQRIPVVFKRDWPRTVRLGDAASWPMVLDGSLSSRTAQAVFASYFHSGTADGAVQSRRDDG